MEFWWYPRCSTCRKAKKYLEEKGVSFETHDLVETPPTKEQLRSWREMSGLELKKFFNTSGVLYREMKLKDRIPDMTEDEMLELLASDGKLVKRPVLVTEKEVFVGFRTPWPEEALR